jgi:hypothetical protein
MKATITAQGKTRADLVALDDLIQFCMERGINVGAIQTPKGISIMLEGSDSNADLDWILQYIQHKHKEFKG